MSPRGKPTIILLNRHRFSSLNIYLYSHILLCFQPSSEKFLLQYMVINTETHNWSICRLRYHRLLSPRYHMPSSAKSSEDHLRRGGKTVRARVSGGLLWNSLSGHDRPLPTWTHSAGDCTHRACIKSSQLKSQTWAEGEAHKIPLLGEDLLAIDSH